MENRIDIPFEIKLEDSDNGVFSGYGSMFNGKPDSYGDIILEGAFAETIQKSGRNGNGIAMLWQHNSHEPIGVWTEIVENSKGLKVTGELILEVQKAKEAYALMKKGAVRGLSIGFDYFRDNKGMPIEGSFEDDDKKGIRYIKKVNLYEISPVTFPANTRATITNVKSIIENSQNERELEEAFREELKMSNSTAKYLVSLVKPVLSEKWKKPEQENTKLIEINNLLHNLNLELNNFGGK